MGQYNARGWIFQVETAVADTWATIGGVTSWSLNKGENEEVADTTTNDSDGQYEQEVMQRGATLEVEGKITHTAGTRDPGQLRVDTLGDEVAEASVGKMRYRHTTQEDWTVWSCTVTPGEQGGETNEKTSWAATFTRSGAETTVAVV